MGLTVTEALSELNLIKKKVEKKREVVLNSLIRPKHLKDKLESSGGSRDFIKAELQSVSDLLARYLKLKGAIADANIKNTIQVNGTTKSIYDWLNWKRDMSNSDLHFNNSVHQSVQKHFDSIAKQPQVFKDDDGKTHLLEYEANVEYGDFVKLAEMTQETLERLDGQLSLKNATILLDV